MLLARLIIKIEETRRELYKISQENPDEILKASQELDILINEYYKYKNMNECRYMLEQYHQLA